MTIKILFVDDEPNIINGLKRMLFSMRKQWNMFFALNGKDALSVMEKEKPDVIVTDMRMPIMNGADLLETVKTKFPSTIRIILSGHSDNEMALKSTTVAHQFLAKPCDAETLKNKINKTLKLRTLLSDKNLIEAVNGIGELPSLPDTYINLDNELKKKDISIGNLADIISKDITLSAKILKIVNSAFFGLPTSITNSNQAVNLLGVNIIKSLILYANTFGASKLPDKSKFYLETLWKHSFDVGNICQKISKLLKLSKQMIDDSYTAGILHDIGKLIFLKNPDYYSSTFDLVDKDEISFLEAEKKLYNANHSELGAYLLGIWGLPDSIVEAVAFHYNPQSVTDSEISILQILHLSNNLANLKTSRDIFESSFDITKTNIQSEYIIKYLSETNINQIIEMVKNE